jgi:hypothetical protein
MPAAASPRSEALREPDAANTVAASAAKPTSVPATNISLPCRLILPDGRVSTGGRTASAHVRAYLRAVVAPQENVARYMEFPRGRRANGELGVTRWPRGNFLDPADRAAIHLHVLGRFSRGDEMFCGPVPRVEPRPRKDAACAGRVLWVDIDRKTDAPPPTLADLERLLAGEEHRPHDGLVAAATLLRFPMPPHVVVYSGSGGAHGYWRIEDVLAAEWIERANARLIHALQADWASYDRNRFLRMPGGVNGKNGRYCQLIYADLTSRAYDVRDLVGGLPDPSADDPRAPKRIRRRDTVPTPRRARIDDPVDRWTPREYFAALCGLTEFDDAGKVPCVLADHHDPRPSLWIGETVEQGWYCFGCLRGGRIYDLASLLIGGPWGADLRGDAFRAARAELERRLGIPIPAGPARP